MSNLAIGIDVGGTNVRVALSNNKGQILKRLTGTTEKKKGPEGVSKHIISMIHSVAGDKFKTNKIKGIGIGSTGPLDLEKGGLMKPTNIPFEFVPLVKPLEEEFHLPVYLLNDCVSAVVGERYFGLGKTFLGHLQVCPGLLKPGKKLGLVQNGKGLPLLHGLPFIHKHLLNTAADLKRKVRLSCFHGPGVIELLALVLPLAEIDQRTDSYEQDKKKDDNNSFFHSCPPRIVFIASLP